MDDYRNQNLKKIDKLLSDCDINSGKQLVKEIVSNIDDRIVELLLSRDSNQYYILTSTRNDVFLMSFVKNDYNSVDLQKDKKINICKAKFIKGTPNGELIITFPNKEWHLKNIIKGRVFDFLQDVKPVNINNAFYDSSIRGEFHQLLDPDHAEEIDKLRRYMQEGHISHYEYDDYNPSISKAGK
ncbi:hypothetical protein DS832_02555 [Bombilactobacillus bombi]|uniref:YokE-like PH domain-containing protein n=1 Tax=Bombilactobacillus bombi TaxID=1303590 RepID=A0A3R6YQ52_9LACO|nr:histidine decarboxylase maturation protein HdcB [Bombilactobacillus bombi]RHW48213.1 hypothetical protein DS832_02555 [Bombilactobacillus bombi]